MLSPEGTHDSSTHVLLAKTRLHSHTKFKKEACNRSECMEIWENKLSVCAMSSKASLQATLDCTVLSVSGIGPSIVQLSLTAAVSFHTPYLSSEKSISILNELINQRLFHKFQPGSCPLRACQQPSMGGGCHPRHPVSSAKARATYPSDRGPLLFPHPSPQPCNPACRCPALA